MATDKDDARKRLFKHTQQRQAHVYAVVDTPQDQQLLRIRQYLQTMDLPEFPNNTARRRFLNKAAQHFVQEGMLFRRYPLRVPVKIIFDPDERQSILKEAHDEHGHKGVQTTFETI